MAGVVAAVGPDVTRVRPGDRVFGAGHATFVEYTLVWETRIAPIPGGVGAFAVQIAKVMSAEVTAVCSTGNVDLVRTLRADHLIDYIKDDPTKSAA